MRTKPAYLIIAFLAAASMPANAAGSSGETPSQQAPAKSGEGSTASAKEKKICKWLETSGSRFAERVCLTKAQWKKVESQG